MIRVRRYWCRSCERTMSRQRKYPMPEHFCFSYCSHGGVCERERGHPGTHDSGFCEWTDAEGITKAEADEKMRANSLLGDVFVAADDIARALDPEERKRLDG